MEIVDKKAVGRKIRELRGERTQAEVANALGIGVMSLSYYERGERVPNDSIKIAMSKYFNTPIESIFFITK